MSTAQNKQILNYLQAGYTITPLDALRMFGCMRLGARVHELRKAGHDIRREIITAEPSGARIAEYFLP